MEQAGVYFLDNARKELGALERVASAQLAKGINSSEEIQLLRSIRKKCAMLSTNPEYGDHIPKRLWPRELVMRYRLTNLWRVELSGYWRMLYTLRGDRVELICFVIELLDHAQYDALFGYRRK